MKTLHKPASLEEALQLQDEYGSKMLWLAGGTLANRPEYKERFEHYVSLDGIGLTGMFEEMHVWHLGSMTTLQELMDTAGIPTAVRKTAGFQESRPLRCMATLGGQLAAMQPLCVPLLALGAELRLALPPSFHDPKNFSNLPEELGEVLHGCAMGRGLDIASYLNFMRPALITCACVSARKKCAVVQQRRSSRSLVLATVAMCWEKPETAPATACMGTLTDLRAQKEEIVPQPAYPVIIAQGAGLDLQSVPEAEQAVLQGLRGTALEKAVSEALCKPDASAKTGQTRISPHWAGSPEYLAQLIAASVAECAAELDSTNAEAEHILK